MSASQFARVRRRALIACRNLAPAWDVAGEHDAADALTRSRERGLPPSSASTGQENYPETAAQATPEVVLDTRLRNEWRDGHVEGAVHAPLYDLTARIPTLPPGDVWVYCESGYRATAAAGLVARTGRRAVVIDDNFSEAAEAGLSITTGD